jgi:hypothetical protein
LLHKGKGKAKMSGERVVSHDKFMLILADAVYYGLCHAPYPSDIPGLDQKSDVLLSIEELGCNLRSLAQPYHHRVRAIPMATRKAVIVDIAEAVWAPLETLEEWTASLSESVSAKHITRAEPEVAATRAASTPPEDAGGEEGPDESGSSGVREPLPGPAPTGTEGASVPSEVPVG